MLRQKISPVLFVIIIICFFFPFVTVSCQGDKLMTLTGVQLVTGTTMNSPGDFSGNKQRDIPPEPIAIVLLGCTLLGLYLGIKKEEVPALAAVSAICVILLLIMKAKIDHDMIKEGEGILMADYGGGFYMMLILFIASTGLNIYSLSEKKKKAALE